MNMINVVSPSRLHLTLIDLNAEIGRVDGGGVGITLESPSLEISASEADTVEVVGSSLLAGRMLKAAKAVIPEGKGGIKIHIKRDLPDHVGLGSGTQAALSVAAAINEIYGLGKSVRELAVAVGRGGTSGIGVAAFEYGGLSWTEVTGSGIKVHFLLPQPAVCLLGLYFSEERFLTGILSLQSPIQKEFMMRKKWIFSKKPVRSLSQKFRRSLT